MRERRQRAKGWEEGRDKVDKMGWAIFMVDKVGWAIFMGLSSLFSLFHDPSIFYFLSIFSILPFFSYHALIKRIIKAFLFSLHADLHAIINLHARRGILDLAY